VLLALILAVTLPESGSAQDPVVQLPHQVEPGDTWQALAWRYGIDADALRAANPHPNLLRQPVIGRVITVPEPAHNERMGLVVNSNDGGLLQVAASTGVSPWQAAIINELPSPYRPLLYRAIFLPAATGAPRQMPTNVRSLQVSRSPAQPGQALAIRGVGSQAPISVRLSGQNLAVFGNGSYFVALGATGAFFPPGEYVLEIQVADGPLWSQPWLVAPGQWTFEEITLTGAAAAIDAESIRQEREHLAQIWSQYGANPLWSGQFTEPLAEYLGISSRYGARRSYGGGPYDRYHEGLDFSAFGGTPVYAPAAGTAVVAEMLAVRGGAVILDHGLGVFTGFYHLSEVAVEPGQAISPGEMVGRVGSTGLSTGNHLHWDLLVGGNWVDPEAWLAQDMACWLLEGWGSPCSRP